MQIQNINIYSSYNNNIPSFGAKKPIDLIYIFDKHKKLLPERISNEVNRIIKSKPNQMPSLKEIHQRSYELLLKDCNTLEEAKRLFPEFKNVQNAIEVFNAPRGNIKKIKENGFLDNSLSLRILQDLWYHLKSQDEIAKELGVKNRSALGWMFKKLGITSVDTNYKTLIMSSDPEGRAIIAGKTTAWNALHPDLMRAKNKKAAQSNKSQKYRLEHSARMKQYDIDHPERKEKISSFGKEVWAKIPEVRKQMSDFVKQQDSYTRGILCKVTRGEKLSETEKRIRKTMYKNFWDQNPECKQMYKKAYEEVTQSRRQNINKK